jgi:hypothetical protein
VYSDCYITPLRAIILPVIVVGGVGVVALPIVVIDVGGVGIVVVISPLTRLIIVVVGPRLHLLSIPCC